MRRAPGTGGAFWEFTSPVSTRQLADWDEGVDFGPPVQCRVRPGHVRPGRRTSPLRVVVPRLPVQNVVWTWGNECLVDDATLRKMRREGLTGFEAAPAWARVADPAESGGAKGRARRASSPRPFRMWELRVTGWGGLAPRQSGVRLRYSCKACGHRRYSCFTDPTRLVDESRWDGSDFFIVWPLPRFVLGSRRVRDFVRDEGISGVRLVPLGRLTCTSGSLTPGSLSDWFPAPRARALARDIVGA